MSSLDFNWAVRGLDAVLRQRQGIEEFTDDPDCVFRISVAPAPRALTLSDGTAIRPPDPLVQIHYWNEHMPLIPAAGHDATWASLFHRRVVHSLALAAELLTRDPRFADVAAIWAAPAFAARAGGPITTARISQRLGFDVLDDQRDDGPIHAWLDSLLIWTLMRTFNPASCRGRGVAHGRVHVWMSRRKLLALYGDRKVFH